MTQEQVDARFTRLAHCTHPQAHHPTVDPCPRCGQTRLILVRLSRADLDHLEAVSTLLDEIATAHG